MQHPQLQTPTPSSQFSDDMESDAPTTVKADSPNPSPCLQPASFSNVQSDLASPILSYITEFPAPVPVALVNISFLNRCSPMAPPVLHSRQPTASITLPNPVDSGVTTLPMDNNNRSPLNIKHLSKIGSKWVTIILNDHDPILSYPEVVLTFKKQLGDSRPLSTDHSSRNKMACITYLKERLEDELDDICGSVTEQEEFNFIIELANNLSFKLKTKPFCQGD
ncbi:hypothetical protein AX17_001815 [Amanita inopinata Kibby_2008]|nr:hypothetical protein AX17_001815 [Amanita inopinata Kibby_2008]